MISHVVILTGSSSSSTEVLKNRHCMMIEQVPLSDWLRHATIISGSQPTRHSPIVSHFSRKRKEVIPQPLKKDIQSDVDNIRECVEMLFGFCLRVLFIM
ncbi:hypothetical protein PUN28_013551 [Cardiocondyla obscurior]|uniref:Uncharacterized protein n=1 Tax=Cardiocondyla obscurior TaxID=286306 RepID=A0AAW2F367_9HYME